MAKTYRERLREEAARILGFPAAEENGGEVKEPQLVRVGYVPYIYEMERPDGTLFRFNLLGQFTNKEFTKEYVAVRDVDDPDEENIILIPCHEGEDGMAVFENFESQEEYEEAEERFYELFNDELYGPGPEYDGIEREDQGIHWDRPEDDGDIDYE